MPSERGGGERRRLVCGDGGVEAVKGRYRGGGGEREGGGLDSGWADPGPPARGVRVNRELS